MNEEKLGEIMRDARMISAYEHLLFPALSANLDRKVEELCAKYVGGNRDLIGDIAQIAYIKELISQFKLTQTKGSKAYEKLHKTEGTP